MIGGPALGWAPLVVLGRLALDSAGRHTGKDAGGRGEAVAVQGIMVDGVLGLCRAGDGGGSRGGAGTVWTVGGMWGEGDQQGEPAEGWGGKPE